MKLTLRWIVGLLLATAGFLKLGAAWSFAETLAAYRLFPAPLNQTLAVVLPWCELAAGLFLLSGFVVRSAAWLSLAMFSAFGAAVLLATTRGLDVECGCFGSGLGLRAGWALGAVDVCGVLGSVWLVVGESQASRPGRIDGLDPSGTPRASVIVPTLNEADNLEHLVRGLMRVLPDAEVVVVDDASTDGTAEKARDLARSFPVQVLERRDERGLASAVLAGLRRAQSDVCVVMDADLSHPTEMVPRLVEAVERGADLAVGSRYVSGGAVAGWPWSRRLTSRAGVLLGRLFTRVRDPMSGFFCLRKSLLGGVPLRPVGFKILLEILARVRPAAVAELPIRFTDRDAGRSKFGWSQRREFLRQIWTLGRETSPPAWRAAVLIGATVLLATAIAVWGSWRGGRISGALTIPFAAVALTGAVAVLTAFGSASPKQDVDAKQDALSEEKRVIAPLR